jgi:cell division protein FtsW (lipid II flippase)
MVDPSINEHGNKLDRLQLFAVAGLMFLGAAFVFSATEANQSPALPWYDQLWLRQIIWYALGLGAAAAVCLVDYHVLARWFSAWSRF